MVRPPIITTRQGVATTGRCRAAPISADSLAAWPSRQLIPNLGARRPRPTRRGRRSSVNSSRRCATWVRRAPRSTRRGRPDPGFLDLARLYDVQLASRHCDLAARWLRCAGQGLLHDRVGRSREQRGRGHGDPTDRSGAAALPQRWLLPRPAPGSTASATSSPVSSRPPASRSPVGGTRCSAATIWRSSRRRRPSPRTSRVPSAWPSRSIGPPSSRWRRRGRPTRSRSAASAMPRPTTRWPPARSTRRSYCAYQRLPLPLLFVCEDNGLGISVRTPPAGSSRPSARGRTCATSPSTVTIRWPSPRPRHGVADWVRRRRKPAFLHLRTVRYRRSRRHRRRGRLSQRRPSCAPTPTATRSSARPGRCWPPAGRPRPCCNATTRSPTWCTAVAAELAEAEQLTDADEVMRPLAIRRPDEVAESRPAAVAACRRPTNR